MEQMYEMTIGLHFAAVLLLIALVGLNAALLYRAEELKRYAKPMRMLMPVFGMLIAATIFTGIVMMAAKHLAFTPANVVMILLSVALIALESKRYATLKHFDLSQENAAALYRRRAFALLGIEGLLLVSMTLWMAL